MRKPYYRVEIGFETCPHRHKTRAAAVRCQQKLIDRQLRGGGSIKWTLSRIVVREDVT